MAIHLVTGRLFLSDAFHARCDYLETHSECRLSQQRRWTNIKLTIGLCPVFADCFCQMALPPNSGILPPNLNNNWMTEMIGWSLHVTGWTTLRLFGDRVRDLDRSFCPVAAQNYWIRIPAGSDRYLSLGFRIYSAPNCSKAWSVQCCLWYCAL